MSWNHHLDVYQGSELRVDFFNRQKLIGFWLQSPPNWITLSKGDRMFNMSAEFMLAICKLTPVWKESASSPNVYMVHPPCVQVHPERYHPHRPHHIYAPWSSKLQFPNLSLISSGGIAQISSEWNVSECLGEGGFAIRASWCSLNQGWFLLQIYTVWRKYIDGATPKRWLSKGPIHGSCAIYFPGGV